ncbi:multidrug transporter [Shewanella sp. 10N.286.51.B7]|uniref:DMT family transporter n=1 Tax=Shewanella sp. 10N.286.51.B7 TaxID=1880836 RepID=UPI000C82798A|nr:EamA family transporter [Shewanella sp. 10N.286.51.B7]PMG80010.1 multidrug transporter [Shewanella sp. 10N.286.51.B7]
MNILLAMIPAFFWGTTYAVTQYTLTDWPPLLLGALRALPAGLILLALKPSLPAAKDWGILTSIGLLNIAIFFSLIFVMALTLPAAISGVGMVSVPVFAMLFHWLFSRTRPKKVQAISGAILIVLSWLLFDPRAIALDPIGLTAMLGAIMCIIVGSTIVKSIGKRIHWWTVLTWQLIIGGVILAVASIIQMQLQPEQYHAVFAGVSSLNFIGLMWIIILNTALGYGLYVWLLQKMSVVDFTFGGIANPIAGIVSGVVLMSESFSIYQYSLMFGMILMSLMPQIVAMIKQRSQSKRH